MIKGYKVTDRNRIKLVGVASDSLRQLLTKGGQKLGIKEEIVASLDDGTVVDDEDYFQTLPAQTIFILYRKGEEVVRGVDFIFNLLRQINLNYLETGSNAEEFLKNKTNELMEILKKCEQEKKEQVWKNTPEEDPDWFKDLETNSTTKNEYMFRKSQSRIRGYFYKFQEDIRKCQNFLNDFRFRKLSEECFQFFKFQLKRDEYFGCYFDRRHATITAEVTTAKKFKIDPIIENGTKFNQIYQKDSFCDDSGNFVCQGKWKSDDCEFISDHQINPYLSKESRILFSTWNLDHRIERSRSVTPTLINTIQACEKSQSVNFLYFYQLMFTKLNLKLVHVVCHDKSVHDVSCDPEFLYT